MGARCCRAPTEICKNPTAKAKLKLWRLPLQGSPWRHLVAGALAGAASRTATAPLETLRVQVRTLCGAACFCQAMQPLRLPTARQLDGVLT